MSLTRDDWDEVKHHILVKHELGLSILEDEVGSDGPFRWYLDLADFPPRLQLTFEGVVDHATAEEVDQMRMQAKGLARKLGLRLYTAPSDEDLAFVLKPNYKRFEGAARG